MKMKSIKLMMALCMILSLLIPSVSFASQNLNVSTEPPVSSNGGITTYGLYTPATFEDLHSYGVMTFSGNATGSNLYLNSGITNVTKVKIEIKNNLSTSMVVVFMKSGFWDSEISRTTVPANATLYYSIGNLDTSGKYYLEFHAPSNFSGTIQEAN